MRRRPSNQLNAETTFQISLPKTSKTVTISSRDQFVSTISNPNLADTHFIIDKKFTGVVILANATQVTAKNCIFEFHPQIQFQDRTLVLVNCQNVALKYYIARLGEKGVLGTSSVPPSGSSKYGRDSLGLYNCTNVSLINCSFWASCDEDLSFSYCNGTRVYQCLITLPLEGGKIHADDDPEHAYGLLARGGNGGFIWNTVIAYARMRLPQMATELAPKGTNIQYDISNCLIYNYLTAGIRYGISGNKDQAPIAGGCLIRNNLIINSAASEGNPIEARYVDNIASLGYKVYVNGNVYMDRNGKASPFTQQMVGADSKETSQWKSARQAQYVASPPFTNEFTPKPVSNPTQFRDTILDAAGAGDAYDQKLKACIKSGKAITDKYFPTLSACFNFVNGKSAQQSQDEPDDDTTVKALSVPEARPSHLVSTSQGIHETEPSHINPTYEGIHETKLAHLQRYTLSVPEAEHSHLDLTSQSTQEAKLEHEGVEASETLADLDSLTASGEN